MLDQTLIDRIINSRLALPAGLPSRQSAEAEGGCGVVGLAASFPVAGKHLIPGAYQMHNRGNGKGGGIAAAGLSAVQMRVSPQILRDATLLQIAYLDPAAREEIENNLLSCSFDILQAYQVDAAHDYRDVPGLEIKPPDVWRYFLRGKEESLTRFAEDSGLQALPRRRLEDEFVYQNSFRLNKAYYASLGEKRAFVLSHGRDMFVFKIVGYAEQAAAYYGLEDCTAHVWIAHQRYPTKGRVWHPGGAHPFVGLNEALVHNGDFANYYSTCTYLRQRNITPLFLTDTEVSALLFDLWDRIYEYPLEVIIEALAPTTERDFAMLPEEKQELYRAIQTAHIHASPDGPWFFIIARSRPDSNEQQLLGITDTSMLRPQVFALMENRAGGENLQIGLIASEKQAIDLTLESMHAHDPRICPVADRYWNARGGSYTDGGSFAFTVTSDPAMTGRRLICTDKFGHVFEAPKDQAHSGPVSLQSTAPRKSAKKKAWIIADSSELDIAWPGFAREITQWGYEDLCAELSRWKEEAKQDEAKLLNVLGMLTRVRDRAYDPGAKRRASILAITDTSISALLSSVPPPGRKKLGRLDHATRNHLQAPKNADSTLVIDVSGFPPEGESSAARFLVDSVTQGWNRLITYNWRGQRFCGCGLGPDSKNVRIDVYGSSGDYLGSGLDGAEIHVHGTAQDQVGQIFNAGKLVIHGDTGQTFMYGAKGGSVFIRGNAAGRPLINAVGRPRVVINGTCLDYLAESFMAGDPLNGGGFVILNAVAFDDHGRMAGMPEPYPGGNLFSLASGGAIYIRDPHQHVTDDQLNGGFFHRLSDADWVLIRPYLEENERLFGISVADLLTVEGSLRKPSEVYRKVAAIRLDVLT